MWNIIKNFCSLKTFILSLFLSPVYAQGITFEEGLSWQQIKDKAKTEGKYIFIDCFATWCGPCKKMDKEVYPSEKVGTFFNDKFIAVKLQMDTTKQDSEQVRNWHTTAFVFKQQYNIKSFPTYLFFSPDGKIVTKHTGYQKPDDFIASANNALNPSKQYYTLLENYQSGKKNYTEMRKLALAALYFGDDKIANAIGREYITSYLTNLRENEFYTKDNIDFVQYFLTTKEKYFNLFYLNRDKIDSVMGKKGFTRNAIDVVIYAEKIYPFLKEANEKNRHPDWDEIMKSMRKTYANYDINRNILSAQLKWYEYKQDWQKYSKIVVKWVTEYRDNLDCHDLNEYAWNMFLHICDSSLLNIALNWSNQSIELCPPDFVPNYIDTKANILYKLGKTEDAISLEEDALNLAKQQKNEGYINSFTENVIKMKKGEPTWVRSKSATQ